MGFILLYNIMTDERLDFGSSTLNSGKAVLLRMCDPNYAGDKLAEKMGRCLGIQHGYFPVMEPRLTQEELKMWWQFDIFFLEQKLNELVPGSNYDWFTKLFIKGVFDQNLTFCPDCMARDWEYTIVYEPAQNIARCMMCGNHDYLYQFTEINMVNTEKAELVDLFKETLTRETGAEKDSREVWIARAKKLIEDAGMKRSHVPPIFGSERLPFSSPNDSAWYMFPSKERNVPGLAGFRS